MYILYMPMFMLLDYTKFLNCSLEIAQEKGKAKDDSLIIARMT